MAVCYIIILFFTHFKVAGIYRNILTKIRLLQESMEHLITVFYSVMKDGCQKNIEI